MDDDDMDVDSPISFLQPELLSEIFLFAVSSLYSSSSSPSETYPLLHTVHILASVCQKWRIVAHSTPALWCSLGFETKYLPHPFRAPIRPPVYRIYPKVELLERWMGRSGAYPLDLTMRTQDRLGTLKEIDEGQERGVVELVKRHHGRIRSLRIVCTTFAKLGLQVLDALVGEGETMPKLEVLEVQVLNILLSEPLTLKIPYSNRLTVLALDLGADARIDTILPSRPFVRLRSLTIGTERENSASLDTDRVLDMLSACSNTLELFSWNTTDLSPPSSTHLQKHVTLPSLTSFHLTSHSPPSSFLSLLTLPALTSFHIVVHPESELPLAFHPGLLSRSLCPKTGKTKLEKIHVETMADVPLHEVLETLRVSPRLESFLFTVPLTEELAFSLTSDSNPSSSSETALAPHVQQMEFARSWEGDYVLLVDAFAKMVLSRWGGPSGLYPGRGALKSIRVDDVHDDERRIMHAHAALKDCIEEGFKLQLVPS